MSRVPEIAERFALATKRYGINPEELFADRDRARSGFCPPVAFERAMSSLGFRFSQADSEALKQVYMENGKMNYSRFLWDVKNPAPAVFSKRIQDNTRQLKEFGMKLQAEGLDVRESILPYDKMRVGHVPREVLFRVFGYSRLVQDIATQYSDDMTGEVNYLVLEEDIQKAMEYKVDEKLGCALPQFFDNFVRCLSSRNINVYDSFAVCDRLKKGYVSMQTFLAVVSSYGVEMSPAQLQELARPFIDDCGNVDYLLFDKTIYDTQRQLDTTKPLSSSAIEASDIYELLDEIRSRLEVRRIRLRDVLETAQRENGGKLTRTKFYKVLGFSGFSFNPSDILALDARFLRSDDTVNIEDFIESVDPPEVVEPKVDADDVVNRLREHMRQNKLSIDKSFLTFDREGSGTVSVGQLISALKSVGFYPSTLELNAVARKFGNGRYVFWRELSDLVEPRVAPPICTTLRTGEYGRTKPAAEVVDFLRRIYPVTVRSRIDVREKCSNVDIYQCGLIDVKRFRAILEDIPARIAGPDITVACRTYTKPGTSTVCYGDFCDDLAEYGPEPVPEVPKQTQPPPETVELQNRAAVAIRKVKAALQYRRLLLEELFVTHDTLKSGTVSAEVFAAEMAPVAQLIGSDVIQLISKAFRDYRQPEKVNYRRLGASLAGVRVVREDIDEINEIQREITGENDGVCLINSALYNKVAERKKNIYDLFVHVPYETVPLKQFENILQSFGLVIPDGEMQKLVRQYRVNRNNDIDWRKFCSDVDEIGKANFSGKF